MTRINKALFMVLAAVASWMALALVGLIAYLVGPALGFVVGGYLLVAVIARDTFRPVARHDD